MKVGLVCSSGGHFTEMVEVMEAFREHHLFLITYKSEATKVLEKEMKVYPINRLINKPVDLRKGILQSLLLTLFKSPFSLISGFLRILFILVRERPKVLFSTGAEIAFPAFYLSKLLFNTKLLYLECSAQVTTPSLTGRLVYPITDLFLVQWKSLLKKYGERAKYVGGLI